MTVILPYDHPAHSTLQGGGLAVSLRPRGDRRAAAAQGEAPLSLAILNLMPNKPVTDLQLIGLLAASERAVEPVWFVPQGYRSGSTPSRYLARFYRPWPEIAAQRFDGLIVTGAPVEQLPFAQVRYWPQLTRIFDWAATAAGQSLFICWGAQAALKHRHNVEKRLLPRKLSGVYRQHTLQPAPILAGLESGFLSPVSRHTEIRLETVPDDSGLRLLAHSPDSGPCLMSEADGSAQYMFNHLEYDADTLLKEFFRDLAAGKRSSVPRNYLPGDDLAGLPQATWQPAARRFFDNWLGLVQASRAKAQQPLDQPRAA